MSNSNEPQDRLALFKIFFWKVCVLKVESVRATKSDKITGDEYNKGDVGLVNSEMQNIRNHRTPWWRPALNMKNPEIDLSTVKVIVSMEDHVRWKHLKIVCYPHSSFRCTVASALRGVR